MIIIQRMSCRTLKSMNVCENNIGAWVDLEVVEAFQDAALEELILEGIDLALILEKGTLLKR